MIVLNYPLIFMGGIMKHLIQTLLTTSKDGALIKYEVYTDLRTLGHYETIPEGTCRVLLSTLSDDGLFRVTNNSVDIQELFDRNQPNPNTWYSDGPDRVNLQMLITYLENLK